MESRGYQLIGTTLGTCTLREVIGAGGMGTVYLARQTRPLRDVAIKVLQPSVATQQEFLARFRREADVIARLDHVNIMPIYEYGEQDGLAYLVMPYLAGGSLQDKLAQRGSLSLQETLTYIEQATAALDYAHSQKIIHRDIKPGNFLFHVDGRLVLADFGIAHLVRESSSEVTLTGTGQFLGSPKYMAPEMIHGEPVDARTDIYELGIVLFQMLTGRVPFQGDSPYSVAAKHLQEVPPPLYQVNPSIPPAIDAVVRKAIAKRREDRYPSAGQLAQALRAAMAVPSAIPANTPPNPSPHSSDPTPATLPANTPYYAVSQNGIATPQNIATGAVTTGQPPSTSSGRKPSWLAWVAVLLIAALMIGGGSLLGIQVLKTLGQQPHTTPTAPAATSTLAPSPTPSPSPTPTPSPSPTPTPSQQAQAVIQRYYNAINQTDYRTAYQQWGSDYQNNQPYDQFASGFANTVHDDLTIQSITPLPDGTVKVQITLYANERSSSGTTVKEFQGYYIVGLENGVWKILSAHLQQVG